MRRRQRTKRLQLTAPVVALLAVTFLVSAGLGMAGFSIVSRTGQVAAAAAGQGECEPEYQKCLKANPKQKDKCENEFQQCVLINRECVYTKEAPAGGKDNFACNKNADCQIHCTESWTSNKKGSGSLVCCKGGAKHVNPCRDEVDGKCVSGPYKGVPKDQAQPPLDGKDKGKEGGGMPKMPEMPKGGEGKPPPKDSGKEAKDQDCQKNPSAPECSKQANKPGYCGIPGATFVTSFFSSKCSEDTSRMQASSTTKDLEGARIEQALKELASGPKAPSSPNSEPSDALPMYKWSGDIKRAEDPRRATAQEPPPAPSQGITQLVTESTFAVPDLPQTPLTQENRTVLQATLDALKNSIVSLLNLLVPGN
ncbi:hypothetical protein A3A39_03880 [Candidatus Kaiserbacteria bacterium RIFCSPLOWO2_01_FULL_54_13]|uniref:Uncharacterized protein n=1 Tax=Candidatus Kaiserbacteria bacterium RIFCSPLOWO2_01_FULL_54_13 TaxID=1798512 RepID=A0A1F6F070_9BACT|nr:MAG: hypothetical protein A3A39_03880 [Candidatus Kaiserbacteria bacterium RIFCSPLOWO2_01_FULL_54_13]